MNFNSPNDFPDSEKKYEYLHSEERLEHLRRIINGRPVAILVAGPSIYELEERVNELSRADICYFGMNAFFVQEDHILKRIDKRFSVLVESPDNANKGLSSIFNRVIYYLDRNDDNLLVSSFSRFNILDSEFNLQKFLDRYDKKLFSLRGSSIDRTVPDNNRPLHFFVGNSLSWLICLAAIGKASKIVLFGADGYTERGAKEIYYRSKEYGTYSVQQFMRQQLMENTNKGFNPIVPISLRNIYRTYHLEPIPIFNCSEVSFYTPFPKVSYDDAFAFLLGRKNAEEISDLRTPTASIIIPSSDDETELQNTLKNIAEQSYSNYECLVIQSKSEAVRRLSFNRIPFSSNRIPSKIRWVIKNDSGFLDTMKNVLSLAQGKYIFYCPSGDGYLDRDWLNSCLEVLENRPQLSLVWGSSQNLLPDGTPGHIDQAYQLIDPPWRKKKFIYYWLKRKNFFPVNTLCVRKKVLGKCLFPANQAQIPDTEFANWLNFNLRFNIAGYLPVFIPITAGYHRPNEMNQESNKLKKDSELLNAYRNKINSYKHHLVFKKMSHHFRDGNGDILPGKFYLSVFLLYDLAKKIKAKLPHFLHSYLNIIRRIVRKCYQK